jgi:hypothetical protein
LDGCYTALDDERAERVRAQAHQRGGRPRRVVHPDRARLVGARTSAALTASSPACRRRARSWRLFRLGVALEAVEVDEHAAPVADDLGVMPGGMETISPGPASASVPASMTTRMRPETIRFALLLQPVRLD